MSKAVVFICDQDFLVPTVGAAVSARSHTADGSVRVLVFVTDISPASLDAVRRIVEPKRVCVRAASRQGFAEVDRAKFNPTHVPVSTLARLWLDELLDADVEKFLYLDGDIDITGPLDPLLALPIPKRGFLAAPDLPLLVEGNKGASARETRAYLDGLGIKCSRNYFNAGVMLVDRSGWGAVARTAREFFLANPERCRYHDQSALNATAGHLRGKLSLLWNYQTDFMAVADPRRWGYQPAIWHFTGFPKAWHGGIFPWGDEFGQSFSLGTELLRPIGFDARAPDIRALAHGVRIREKLEKRLKWVYPWRRLGRSYMIKGLLAAM